MKLSGVAGDWRLRSRARRFRIAIKAMTLLGKQLSLTKRGLCLNAAISLLFFLIFSAPHRVHHFFEQTSTPAAHRVAHGQAHDHFNGNDRDAHDQSPPASKQSDCAVLSVAQTAHGSLVALFTLPIFDGAATCRHDHRVTTVVSRHFSLASPRAPPQL